MNTDLKKTKIEKKNLLVSLFFFFLSSVCLYGVPDSIQESGDIEKPEIPAVFIECDDCDLDYIKNQIKFVNHVRSENEAQVVINITSEKSVTEGIEYTIKFRGCAEFQSDDDIIKYISETDVWEDLKTGLIDTLKMGLMRYVGKCVVSERISINFLDQVKPTDVEFLGFQPKRQHFSKR
jgi:hypothetical protein